MGSAISDKFMKDLQGDGLLSGLTKKIQGDDTLMLALRGHYINVYYRGGSIMHVSEQANGYAAKFDLNYAKGKDLGLPTGTIQTAADCSNWVTALPRLKEAMNFHFAQTRKSEREFQQLAAWENNRSVLSNDTEYFITDIEFADRDQGARLDMVGLKWPSSQRKDETRCTPVFIEMKYGTGSYDGSAGIAKHIADLGNILGDAVKRESLSRTIEDQFDQLMKLQLVDFTPHKKYGRAVVSEKPEVVFLLANHNPRSRRLLNIVNDIKESEHFDLRFFTASFAGYGMHSACMLKLHEFRALLQRFAG